MKSEIEEIRIVRDKTNLSWNIAINGVWISENRVITDFSTLSEAIEYIDRGNPLINKARFNEE